MVTSDLECLSRPNLRDIPDTSSNLARHLVHLREKIGICPFDGRFVKLSCPKLTTNTQGSVLHYTPAFLSPEEATELYQDLVHAASVVPWEQVALFGKHIKS